MLHNCTADKYMLAQAAPINVTDGLSHMAEEVTRLNAICAATAALIIPDSTASSAQLAGSAVQPDTPQVSQMRPGKHVAMVNC